jgi:tRNA 2-thiouridine synthesizing protein A
MRHKRVIDKILNVKGLLCPAPTVMTIKTLKEMGKGKTLQVITDDITTKQSIPLLCSEEGYRLVELKEKEGLLYFIIHK